MPVQFDPAQLNPAQQAVVEHDAGPLLVLAGAGSGKTRVVTMRIARLLERGVPARAILAMTFTNKAAEEMHHRVTQLVGQKAARPLTVSTFHRFGLDVLSAETRALGLRGTKFAIVDQGDAMGILREIVRTVDLGRSFDLGAILTRISAAKNAFVTPDEWRKAQRKSKGISDYDEAAMVLYPKYQEALRSLQAFDFDDLLCEVVNLWKRRPDVLAKYRARFRYVIVDEYQDTNRAQLELVRLLVEEHRNVCVVGDDDQSIYAWRGADVSNILDFEEHFAGAKVIKLEHNYRSVKPVLDVANAALASSNMRRHGKILRATRESDHLPRLVVAADGELESGFVAREIERLMGEEGARPRDFAVLYRSNIQAPAIELALRERRIPLRQVGGTNLMERKEAKDLLAYLRVVVEPSDEIALRRVLNYPARGIGEAALARLASHATAYDLTLYEAVSKPHAVRDLPSSAMEGCRAFVKLVEAHRAQLEQGITAGKMARSLAEEAKLHEDISKSSASAAQADRRWGNIEGLLRLFDRRDEAGKGSRDELDGLLRILQLRIESDDDAPEDAVTLTTMHGAKGLEFPRVFVVGLEEGLLPHQRSLTERATDDAPSFAESDGDAGGHSIDEERRLFYVAVTRAKDQLWLVRAKARTLRGKPVPRTPSRFLGDIPDDLWVLQEENVPVAPPIAVARSGAAEVLAALGFGPPAVGRPAVPGGASSGSAAPALTLVPRPGMARPGMPPRRR